LLWRTLEQPDTFGFSTITSGSNGMIRAPSLKLQASSTTLLYL